MPETDLHANAILAALSEAEFDRLRDRLEVVEHGIKETVYEREKPFPAVYFPLESVFSMLVGLENDVSIEVGTIGFEGMVGLPAFLGSRTSPHIAYCQVPGTSARLSVADLTAVLTGDGGLREQLNQYTSATMVQLAQNIACNGTHRAEQRACRWLLTTHDRVRRDEYLLTQEFLAQMLALRRPSVSELAGRLAADGLISYRRGRMRIVDREGLEARTCQCYWIIRRSTPQLGSRRVVSPTEGTATPTATH